jgi:CheY-like chemotaxis protein
MRTILVVDDDAALLELLVEALRDEGFLVVDAVDGVTALESLEATMVDLVIADTMMPRLDGLGLVRAMRQRANLRHLPVILISAVSQPNLDGLEAVTFVPKPFDLTVLLNMLAAAL